MAGHMLCLFMPSCSSGSLPECQARQHWLFDTASQQSSTHRHQNLCTETLTRIWGIGTLPPALGGAPTQTWDRAARHSPNGWPVWLDPITLVVRGGSAGREETRDLWRLVLGRGMVAKAVRPRGRPDAWDDPTLGCVSWRSRLVCGRILVQCDHEVIVAVLPLLRHWKRRRRLRIAL